MEKIKRKTVNSEGKMFWGYKYLKNTKRPIWLSPESFAKWEKARKAFARRQSAKIKAKTEQLHNRKLSLGTFNEETGLYYIRATADGKGRWGTYEEVEILKEKKKKQNLEYRIRCKNNFPLPSVAPGDKHPTQEGLFVVKIVGNKPFYGTHEQYLERRNRLIQTYKQYKLRNKEIISKKRSAKRKAEMERLKANPHLKRSRGDLDPVLNRFFWKYDSVGREVWLNPEKYADRKKKSAESKRRRRLRSENKNKS